MGVGPVFTYYEFKHPMNDRLTDEAWKTMIQGSQKPDRPSWTYSYSLGNGLADLSEQAPDLPEPTEPVQEPPVVSPPVTTWSPNPFLPIPGSIYPVSPWSAWTTPGMNPNPYSLSYPLGTNTLQEPSVYNLFQNWQIPQSQYFSLYSFNIYTPTAAPFLGYANNSTFSSGGYQWGMIQGMIQDFSNYNQYRYIPSYFWNIDPGFDF